MAQTERFHDEIEELRGLRDELKVQVQLGKMEAQERFEKAEQDWEHLEAKLRLLASESRESFSEVGEAARLLAGEIRASYRHLRGLL